MAETIVVTLTGVVDRVAIPALCEQLRARLSTMEAGTCDVVCDAGALLVADIVAVEALARLQLTARRLGHRLQLRDASAELRALLALTGLTGVVPVAPLRSGEAQRHTEQREQPLGVEEEGHTGDPPLG